MWKCNHKDQLDQIHHLLVEVALINLSIERKQMALSDDFKAAYAALFASVDQALALLAQLAAGGGVSAADAQAAIDAFNAEKAKVDAEVSKDSPPAPPAA